MKKYLFAAALAAAGFLLSGCATTPQTPADLAAQVQKACAIAVPTIASMQAMQDQLTEAQQADLAKAADLSTTVCTMDLTPVPQTVAEFVQAAFPTVIRIVQASPMLPQDKATVSVALTAAQVALSVALAQ